MSNKMLKDEKAKTASAPNSLLLGFISVFTALVFTAGIVTLAVLRPKPPLASGNCQGLLSKSQLFHCNITELEYAVEPGKGQRVFRAGSGWQITRGWSLSLKHRWVNAYG